MIAHRETRIVPYTADLMYRVVAEVEKYPEFLPWVVALRILSRRGDSLVAEMAVGYGALRERYTSEVKLDPAARRIDVVQTKGPFRQLENHWRFTPKGEGCEIEFSIAFEFRNRMLSKVAGNAFEKVMLTMADAFVARAAALSRPACWAYSLRQGIPSRCRREAFVKRLFCAAAVFALIAAPVSARTILFIGNSFTFAANSPAHYYKPDTVTDLNGPGPTGKTVGGVPAIFKAFTKEAGLDYTVSLETVGGKGMDYHFAQKRALLDKSWDVVVMHGYSTLDIDHPGNPALLVQSAKQMTDMLRARNRRADVWLTATWSRADQTYPDGKPWHGKPIQQMGIDVAAAYDMAAKKRACHQDRPDGPGLEPRH